MALAATGLGGSSATWAKYFKTKKELLEQIISLLMRYGYVILFPLAIVEGPIISVITGLLCATKILDPLIAIPVIVIGDVMGDSFYYGLGRWRRKKVFPRRLRWLSPNPKKMDRVRKYFDANPIRTIFLSKIILGVGVAGLYLAGSAKIPYKKILPICLGASLLQCAVYVTVGFLFGAAYLKIGRLLNGVATFTIVAAVAAALFFS